MQSLGAFLMIIALVAVGYLAYPLFEPHFAQWGWTKGMGERFGEKRERASINAPEESNKSSGKAEQEPEVAAPSSQPQNVSKAPTRTDLPVELQGLSSDRLPAQLRLKTMADFRDLENPTAEPVSMMEFSLVVPVKFDDGELELAPRLGSSLRARVSWEETDLLERLRGEGPDSVLGSGEGVDLGVEENEKMDSGMSEEAAEQAELPAPPALILVGEAEAKLVAKKHLQNADLSELSYDQVIGVTYLGEQELGAERFEVLEVEAERKSLFGDRRVNARALIRNGEVVTWQWSESGLNVN